VFAYLPIPCLQDAASALPDLHILHATIAWWVPPPPTLHFFFTSF
jgi:hypothetical protein